MSLVRWQLFPLVNIDGTINGNYMNGLTGYDFNTVWDDPDRDRQPEVFHIKQHLRALAVGILSLICTETLVVILRVFESL